MRLALGCALATLAIVLPVHAQGGLFGASPHRPPAEDRTGTNPLNLRQQIDVTAVYAELGDLYLDALTYRHAVPLVNGRLSLAGSVPMVAGNLTGRTETGLGDVGASIEWTPWLSRRGGLVTGLAATWNTATVDALGLRVPTLTPYAQLVLYASPRAILAPLVAYRFDVGGDDFAPHVKDTRVALLGVWRVTPHMWLSAQPQVVVDTALGATYGEVSGEVGWQVTRAFSAYARPAAGLGTGGTKPHDWALTAGIRWVR